MARLRTAYEPRPPGQGALYRTVHDHFETFRAQAAAVRDGEGLPRVVEQAFRDFLACGWLAGGFARLRCADRGLDRPGSWRGPRGNGAVLRARLALGGADATHVSMCWPVPGVAGACG